ADDPARDRQDGGASRTRRKDTDDPDDRRRDDDAHEWKRPASLFDSAEQAARPQRTMLVWLGQEIQKVPWEVISLTHYAPRALSRARGGERRRGLLRSAPRGIAMDRRPGAARSEDLDA